MRVWAGLLLGLCLLGTSAAAQRVPLWKIRTPDCAFPTCFPDSTNTGVPAGTSLTAYSGANPVTVNGTTIDSKTITGCPLIIQAINVTITKSFFNCTAASAVSIDDQGMYAATSNGTVFAVTLQDVKISCGTTAGGVGKTGVQEAYAHLQRVEIVHCENGTSMNQLLTVEDSFIHDYASDFGGSHSDGGEAPCGHYENNTEAGNCAGTGWRKGSKNITWTHNRIRGMSSNGSLDNTFETSALIFNHGTDPDTNILVQQNWLSGGSFTLYCVQDGVAGTNFQVLNNHFSTEFSANVGFSGPSDSCANETLSGNVYHETGLPITLASLWDLWKRPWAWA